MFKKDEDQFSYLWKYTELTLSSQNSYHHHKERMAYFAFLLSATLCTWVITSTTFPPTWIVDFLGYPSGTLVVLMVFICVWFLLHQYIKWQLMNRRLAALSVAALSRALRSWSVKRPSNNQLRVASKQEIEVFLKDHAHLNIGDIKIAGTPYPLLKFILEQHEHGTGATKAENIMIASNVLFCIFGTLRILAS